MFDDHLTYGMLADDIEFLSWTIWISCAIIIGITIGIIIQIYFPHTFNFTVNINWSNIDTFHSNLFLMPVK